MKRIILATTSILALGACASLPKEDQPKECGVEIIYTKEGFKITDDQACIPDPKTSVEVERPRTPKTPRTPKPPTTLPPVEVIEVVETVINNEHEDNGFGNGDQDAPGGSEHNNGAENKGGNHNGRDEAPGKSWHE